MLRRSVKCARILSTVLLSYWLLLVILTHVPAGFGPGGPPGSDKAAHFVAYSILAFLIAWTISARYRISSYAYARILLACMAYAIVDELTQIPVPGRMADVRDALADAAGAILGLAAHWLWQRLIDHLAIRRLTQLQDLRRLRSLPR